MGCKQHVALATMSAKNQWNVDHCLMNFMDKGKYLKFMEVFELVKKGALEKAPFCLAMKRIKIHPFSKAHCQSLASNTIGNHHEDKGTSHPHHTPLRL